MRLETSILHRHLNTKMANGTRNDLPASSLRVAYWNCRGIIGKKPDVEKLLEGLDVLVAAETCLSGPSEFSVRDFEVVRSDSGPGKRGIAVLVRRRLNYRCIDFQRTLDPSIECLAIEIFSRGKSNRIVGIYRHPNIPPSRDSIRKIMAFAGSNPSSIVVGDFNAHHPLWGSQRTSLAGRLIVEEMQDYNVVLLSSPSHTFLPPPPKNPSTLDLVFASPDVAPLVECTVHDDLCGSDHLPIFISINKMYDSVESFSCKRRIAPKQWKVIEENLSLLSESLIKKISEISICDPLAKYQTFFSEVEEVVNKVCPPPRNCSGRFSYNKGSRRGSPPAPWWSAECAEAISRRKAAYREYRHNPTVENYDLLKKQINDSRQVLRLAKRNGWREYCASLGPLTPSTEVWAMIKRFRNKRLVSPAMNSNKSGKKELDPVLIEAMDKLCPPSCSTPPLTFNSVPGNPHEWIDSPFTFQEFLTAITVSKRKSSPGMDRIDYALIRALPRSLLLTLLDIVNSLFSEGVFPSSWQHSLVHLIPKPQGKGYRPIALTSCVLKLVEKMLLNRIHWLMENQVLLPEFQFGFRSFRSCLDNLTILTADIQSGFLQQKHTAALFIDVKSAFDNVQPNLLLQELVALNIPPKSLTFIANLISSRTVQFVAQGRLHPERISRKGTPQGAVLSPTLFNLYLRKIASALHPDTKIIQFADDIMIYSTSSDPNRAMRSIQISLENIGDFLQQLGLEISPDKTQLMMFSRSLKVANSKHTIAYKGTNISSSSSAKFLGVILDPGLTGKSHLEYINHKVRNISQVLSMLRGVWWGSPPQMLLTVYRALCRSVMEYASQIFCLEHSRSRQKLEVAQHAALRTCLGLRISTPLNVLFAEAREPPFKLRVRYLAARYLYKIISITDHPVTEKLENLMVLTDSPARRLYVAKNFPLIPIFRQMQHHKQVIHHTVILPKYSYSYESMFAFPEVHYFPEELLPLLNDSPASAAQSVFLETFQKFLEHAIVFYTDGSRVDESSCVGAAWHSPQLGLEIMDKLPHHASVFSAEAWAIYNVIISLKEYGIDDAVIVSDAKSVLQALEGSVLYKNNYLIPRIKAELEKAGREGIRVRLIWVPSHRGISGNERADVLAKRAIKEGRSNFFRVPLSDFFAVPRSRLGVNFENYLDFWANVKGVQYFRKIYCKQKKPWYYHYTIDRRAIVTVSRIRSNHYSLNHSLNRKNLVDDPSCSCGHPIQDINHVVFDCPETANHAQPLRNFVARISIGAFCRKDIFEVLKKPSVQLCRLVSAFCKACNIFI